jgi:hypothetical protein
VSPTIRVLNSVKTTTDFVASPAIHVLVKTKTIADFMKLLSASILEKGEGRLA